MKSTYLKYLILAFSTTGAGWKPFFKHDKSPTTNDVSSEPIWTDLVSLLLFLFSKSIIECWLTFSQWLSETGGGRIWCDGNEAASDGDCSSTDVRLKLALRWAAAIRAKRIFFYEMDYLLKVVVSVFEWSFVLVF